MPAAGPDGRLISFNTDSGFKVLDLASRSSRLVMSERPGRGGATAWSADSKTLYAAAEDSLGRLTIQAVSLAGKGRRVIAYADEPQRQRHRHGLWFSQGRLYLPLFERRADLWVGEIQQR